MTRIGPLEVGSPQQVGDPRGRPGSAKRPGGFTLLEVLIVLVIGAAAYALVLSLPLGGTSSAELKSAARALAAGLRQAQATAMATRRDAVLTVDVEDRQFVVSGQEGMRQLARNLEIKLYTAQDEVTSERRGAIRFYPDGSSTGGRITVASGERKYLVDVDWLTGRVAIRD